MSLKRISLFYAGVCMAAYMAIWLGSLLPGNLESAVLDYISVGVFLALFFVSVGVVFIYSKAISNKIYYGILAINALCLGLSYLEIHLIVLNISAVSQGLLFSIIVKAIIMNGPDQIKNFSSFALGVVLAAGMNFLPGEIINSYLIAALMLFILFFFNAGKTLISVENEQLLPKLQKRHLIVFGVFAIIIFLEINFLVWSLILKDESQGIVHQFTLILTCLMIFLFRRYFYRLKLKLSNIGWLFTCSILLTIGIGMLYTFNITVFFILVFSFSISYLYAIARAVSGISFPSHHIAILSFIIALFMFIFGLIVQNHLEFAQAINIPENVLALSARQALMKEMASVSAFLIILTGVLFLYRRKWKYESFNF
jgi:hypothetical protein